MSAKPKNPYADYEFLRASIVEQEELRATHNVQVVRTIVLVPRPVSLQLRLEAYDTDAHPMDRPLCAYQGNWPNAHEQTFAAFLFKAHALLTRLVEDARRDELMASSRAQ